MDKIEISVQLTGQDRDYTLVILDVVVKGITVVLLLVMGVVTPAVA